jgi:hypothetical protein
MLPPPDCSKEAFSAPATLYINKQASTLSRTLQHAQTMAQSLRAVFAIYPNSCRAPCVPVTVPLSEPPCVASVQLDLSQENLADRKDLLEFRVPKNPGNRHGLLRSSCFWKDFVSRLEIPQEVLCQMLNTVELLEAPHLPVIPPIISKSPPKLVLPTGRQAAWSPK